MNLGVYIHIPFCLQKCLYCDFPSHSGLYRLYSAYVAALAKELSFKSRILAKYSVDTIYIGGGTPTVLCEDLLEKLFSAIKENLNIASEAEISLEANPGTLSHNKALLLAGCGVNRISLGVQSFSDRLLSSIGRIHSAAEAKQAVQNIFAAGIGNINLDLMYGLPEQSIEDLLISLQTAVKLGVPHLSVYGLKVEEGTAFAQMREAFRLSLPDEAYEEAMYELAINFLGQQRFLRYEISNYAQTGRECRNNLKYWQYEPYIGIGAYAHSFFLGKRMVNICDIGKYIEYINKGKSIIESVEPQDKLTSMAEFAFMALRTNKGLNIARFYETFGESLMVRYGRKISLLEKQGLLNINSDRVYLTAKGMKYGNHVFGSFI